MLLIVLLLVWMAASCTPSPQVADVPNVRVLTAVELRKCVKEFTAPVTLVHVWATWCEPCREEFPLLLRLRQAYTNRGLDVIFVSADSPDTQTTVRRYLAEQGARFGASLIDNPNAAFINTLCTNWSGALPASFFFAPGGRLQRWWEGAAEYARYRDTTEQLLEQSQKRR